MDQPIIDRHLGEDVLRAAVACFYGRDGLATLDDIQLCLWEHGGCEYLDLPNPELCDEHEHRPFNAS